MCEGDTMLLPSGKMEKWDLGAHTSLWICGFFIQKLKTSNTTFFCYFKVTPVQIPISNCSCSLNKLISIQNTISTKVKPHQQIKKICNCSFFMKYLGGLSNAPTQNQMTSYFQIYCQPSFCYASPHLHFGRNEVAAKH